MLQITNEFRPYRMKMSRKEPVKMKLAIKNIGNTQELVSYEMVLPPTLSLDKSGFKGAHANKLGALQPGAIHAEHFELHARPATLSGIHTISVRAQEHYNSYDFTMKEYRKKIELIVDE